MKSPKVNSVEGRTASNPKARVTSRGSKPRKPAAKPKAPKRTNENVASRLIDERIRSLGDWRAEIMAEVRRNIHEADPDIEEECKWIKTSNPSVVPVWSHAGIICTGEAYKHVVKLTFARGASLEDPRKLFNSSLGGNTRRAIDIREGEVLDAEAFKALIHAAVAANFRSSAPTPLNRDAESSEKSADSKKTKPVKLLSGGNPQIAKADGDAPVQEYIAAMPGWKRDIGCRLDALIVRTVPNVCKAVKWNTPFYGVAGQGFFLGFHCITKYVKVAFFRGTSLRPVPPGESKQKDVRYLDIYENDQFDETQFATWVKQAAALPGWIP